MSDSENNNQELSLSDQKQVLTHFPNQSIQKASCIQTLWSGYGKIMRCELTSGQVNSVIIKKVTVPNKVAHPRGWNTDVSHHRKMHSYFVESNWYQDWSNQCGDVCRVPTCYSVAVSETDFLILLEDLDAASYPGRVTTPSLDNMRVCLRWLANFHATFMGCCIEEKDDRLWRDGTYWHLDTRKDELAAMADSELKAAAFKIDSALNNCRHKTIIHGDAKLANFCFSTDEKTVAAVDFQYVGGGCGMKDVVLFISSGLESEACYEHAEGLLNNYFEELFIALGKNSVALDAQALEEEWRALYVVAWADFVRFLKGWSPGHWKLHAYSLDMTERALSELAGKALKSS